MSSNEHGQPIPLYSTLGKWSGLLDYPFLFNVQGEWIGWVTEDRKVYDVNGLYVGWLSKDRRILRRRNPSPEKRRLPPPDPPTFIRAPSTIPLAPLMSELSFGVIDVFDEEPDLLHTVDSGELKEDMD
jgi:hypothetical protein